LRLLIDTHILLWLMDDDPRLGIRARNCIMDASEVVVSLASIWEIAIKIPIGKLNVNLDSLLLRLDQAGLIELSVTTRHAAVCAKLPLHHRDPFDRLLVAQAISEGMRLLTADTQLRAYSDLVECV
jgi:PIN domain nuclease of toxin-antitoxin system